MQLVDSSLSLLRHFRALLLIILGGLPFPADSCPETLILIYSFFN